MKKIIAITAMAATMVASAMAVELSGQVKATGTVMGYDGTDFTALSVDNFNNSGDTKFAASVSGEKAGASIELKNGGYFVDATVWVAPVNGLKFSLGKVATGSIAQDNFAWWAQNGKTEVPQGLKVECSFGAFGASAVLDCKSAWVNGGVGNFTAEANYNVDGIGKFQLVVAKGTTSAYGAGGWAPFEYAFGLAYNKMPWETTGFYADVFFGLNADDVNWDGTYGGSNAIYSHFGGQYIANGLALRLTNALGYVFDGDFSYGFMFKASYAMGAATPYAKLEGDGIMNKKLGIVVGSEFNVGEAAIDVSLNVPVEFADTYKFNFSMPISVTVAL